MAKVSYTKLNLKVDNSTKTVKINEQDIEVKQYLPIADKLQLITNVANLSADENNFANPVKIELFGSLQIIENYTNITFTDKQKEDPAKLYDALVSTGTLDKIIEVIPKVEYASIIDSINECIEAIYAQKNSALGIMEAMANGYSDLDFDAGQLQEKIADPENLTLLKDVLTKLG